MRDTYSLYEAKAKLSAIIRQVREGHPVTVTLNGEPVVEIRPIKGQNEGLESRLKALTERGVLVPAENSRFQLKPIARRPGALKRFLAERD
jgi:prevent-host-death family protein